ncbi:MAG: hypothetical protein ACREJC_13555 [Tepidisphaeraceae bacterium]
MITSNEKQPARMRVLLILTALCSGCTAHSSAPNPAGGRSTHLRNVRCCEIFVVKRSWFTVTADVYNTVGLNDCPHELWKSIDAPALARELHAQQVIENGPRHFMMDHNAVAEMGPVVTFHGLPMRRVAVLHPTARNVHERRPYFENAVKRQTEYVFLAGKPVYELTSPDGRTYIMQSYAQIVDENLTEASLSGLGGRLHLPPGWKYRARTLDADLTVRSNGTAYVIQDELQNTYQRL